MPKSLSALISKFVHTLRTRAALFVARFKAWPWYLRAVPLALVFAAASGGTAVTVTLTSRDRPPVVATTHTTVSAPPVALPNKQQSSSAQKAAPPAMTPQPSPTKSDTGKSKGVTSPKSTPGQTNSSGGAAGTNSGDTTKTPAAPYVRPGTQGYRGSQADLTVYSAANGIVPPGTNCSWNQTYKYLRCNDTNLSLDHAYVQGGLYWAGCGSLTLTSSVFDWYPSQSWFDVYNACATPNTGATITATNSTFQTSPDVMHYTGGSDIGGITEYTGDVPMHISHSLVQGFSQGFDPDGGSVVSSSEIYIQDNTCSSGGICHGDGLFSQGGDNILYEDNYIVATSDGTGAVFYQSSPNSSGNRVIGNYLQGGSYALYNETSNGVDVENNTFGGSTYGDCSLSAGASWGTWSGNVNKNGVTVVPQGNGCTQQP